MPKRVALTGGRECVLRDPKEVVRFTSFHPVHQTDSFFYSLLLEHIPFTSESDLLIVNGQRAKNYQHACQLHGIDSDESELREVAEKYAAHHFLSTSDTEHVLHTLLQVLDPSLADELGDLPNEDTTVDEALAKLRERMVSEFGTDFPSTPPPLNAQQQRVWDHLHAGLPGLFLLTG